MSNFDVAARLAAGQPAVEHIARYVWAAHVLGYQHPDLTLHGGQVQDWYDGETGLDLTVLDGDCAVLRAVAGATEEALRAQRAHIGEVAAAWAGPGGEVAAEFLQRHCDAGDEVVAAVRTAAQRCQALVDELWRLVDDKVATAIDIDERSGAQRPAWLAAAQTVTSGAGDRSVAEEIIEHQVKPYVDNEIRTGWLTAMRSARTAVQASYNAAIDALTATPVARFEIPGEFAAPYQPPRLDDPAPPAPVAPAAAVVPPADLPPTRPDPVSPAAAPDDPLPAPLGNAAGLPADTGLPIGAGLPSGAGNPGGGLIPRIADAIGSLLGSPDDGLTDPELDEPFDDEPFEDEPFDDEPFEDEPFDDEQLDDERLDDESDDPEPGPEPTEPAPMPADDVAADAADDDEVALPTEEQVAPPPAAPGPQTEADSTPCEIAADELPQAGT